MQKGRTLNMAITFKEKNFEKKTEKRLQNLERFFDLNSLSHGIKPVRVKATQVQDRKTHLRIHLSLKIQAQIKKKVRKLAY